MVLLLLTAMVATFTMRSTIVALVAYVTRSGNKKMANAVILPVTVVANVMLTKPVVKTEFLNITSRPTVVILDGRMAVSTVLAAT